MARRELGPAALQVAQAVAAMLPAGQVVIGCSGGADSLALTLGAQWAASRCDAELQVAVVDHGLQPGSAAHTQNVVSQLRQRGLAATGYPVQVAPLAGESLEASARDARLGLLASFELPVLLGHTMDDQAESVLLGLLRGSGPRSLAGMAAVRGPFIRPLLGLRRATTIQACQEWEIAPWQDPHNQDQRFARVQARAHLAALEADLGRDLAPALARSAALARIDADFLDELANQRSGDLELSQPQLAVREIVDLPAALRLRVLRDWLANQQLTETTMVQLLAVDALVSAWRGQGPVALAGAKVSRNADQLRIDFSGQLG